MGQMVVEMLAIVAHNSRATIRCKTLEKDTHYQLATVFIFFVRPAACMQLDSIQSLLPIHISFKITYDSGVSGCASHCYCIKSLNFN